MIKKCIICFVLLFCAFFIGACIVEAEEEKKTTNLSQLVEVINNGEYTKYLKEGTTDKSYLVAELGENELILKLSSDASKFVNVRYNANENTISFQEGTTEKGIAEIYNLMGSMYFWILEACGYGLKDLTEIFFEMFIIDETYFDFDGSINRLEISTNVNGDSVTSTIDMELELNNNAYILYMNGINKMKNERYSNPIPTDRNVTLELLVDIINNGIYTTKVLKPSIKEDDLVPSVSASIVDGNLVLTSVKNPSKSIILVYNSEDNSLNFDRKTITDIEEAYIFTNVGYIRYWLMEAYGTNLHDIKIVALSTLTDQDTDYNQIGFSYLYDAQNFTNDSCELGALLKAELSSKYFNYGNTLIDKFYEDLDNSSDVKDDSEEETTDDDDVDNPTEEEVPAGEVNPNTGITDNFWVVLIALLGVFLVLISQKNKKIFKI